MNVAMAFFDLVPVILFLIAAIVLQRLLYSRMGKGSYALFAGGTIFVASAGFLKAIHKILFYLNICDFTPLEAAFFPMQTLGFVFAGLGILGEFFYKEKEIKVKSIIPLPLVLIILNEVTPKEFKGTMIFVVLMVIGVLMLDISLSIIALRKKMIVCFIFIIISFIGTLGMGYLSSNGNISDWVKEIVNTIAQGSLLISAILFKKQDQKERLEN